MASAQKQSDVKRIVVAPVSTDKNVYLLQLRNKKEKRRNFNSNVCCVIIGVIIFGSSVALITVGAVKSLDDLLILGLLFILGGLIVLVLMVGKFLYPIWIKARAKVSDKYTDDAADKNQKNDGNISKNLKTFDNVTNRDISGPTGWSKLEEQKPPPGTNNIVTEKVLRFQEEGYLEGQNIDIDDVSKKPTPPFETLYNDETNLRAVKQSPPPPYVMYPSERIDDVTDPTYKSYKLTELKLDPDNGDNTTNLATLDSVEKSNLENAS